MKKVLFIISLFIGSYSYASNTPQVIILPSQVIISSYGAVGGSTMTITIASPTTSGAYSSGYSNYLSELHIDEFATANLNGQASPYQCTITGINTTTLIIPMPTNASAGIVSRLDLTIEHPIQAPAGNQIVISCPGVANVIWNIWAGYQVGP